MTESALPFRVIGQLPELSDTTLVVMLTGWIDASGAAAAAVDHLVSATHAQAVIEFDEDTFIDYRARRPVMELREGVNTNIIWSTPQLRHGRDDAGKDLLILHGPEPDTAWRQFARAVVGVSRQLGVTRMVGLGAYPFGAPHTRAVGLTATSPRADIIDALGLSKSSLDAPAGVQAILEHSFTDATIDAYGLWAQIPHYVSSMAYPAASAALLEALCRETGLIVDTGALRREASIQRERLDQLVEANPEHADMLRKLEAAYDAMTPPMAALDQPIPSVEEIAAEVEQFLREQHDNPQGD